MVLEAPIARPKARYERLDPGPRAWLGSSVKFSTFPGASLLSIAVLTLCPPTQAESGPAATSVETSLKSVEARTEYRAVLAPYLERARHALSRAKSARGAGDHQHGAELEALAQEITSTAVDLTRALDSEKKLEETQRRAMEIETRAVRAEALVEQTVARRGRAAEELRAIEAEAQKASKPGTEKHPGGQR